MESLQQIKQRIKSVKNINQITKAMELVAATKMRKSQEIALRSRAYAYAALEFLADLSHLHISREATLSEVEGSALFAKRQVKRRMVVLVTSDKGLAGSFNSTVIKNFEKWMANSKWQIANGTETVFVAVGQKAKTYLERFISLQAISYKLKAHFVRVGDYTSVEEVRPIANVIIESFLKSPSDESFSSRNVPISSEARNDDESVLGESTEEKLKKPQPKLGDWSGKGIRPTGSECDEVLLFSTHFRSALRQEVMQRKILPVSFESITTTLNELVPERGRFAESTQHPAPSTQSTISSSPPPKPSSTTSPATLFLWRYTMLFSKRTPRSTPRAVSQ